MSYTNSMLFDPSASAINLEWFINDNGIKKIENYKEKHYCEYCHTKSEKTDNRGNCVSCGAPFEKKKSGILEEYSDRACGWVEPNDSPVTAEGIRELLKKL